MDQSGAFAIDEDPVPEVFCKEYRTLTAMLMETRLKMKSRMWI